jgi:hypothetical protein
LTWEGLKVAGNDGAEARIGKYTTQNLEEVILNITDKQQNSLMSYNTDGVLKTGGWTITPNKLYYPANYMDNGISVSGVGMQPGSSETSPVFWAGFLDNKSG